VQIQNCWGRGRYIVSPQQLSLEGGYQRTSFLYFSHPVASLLCDMPEYEDSVAAIIDPEFQRITINVRHFTTPPQVVNTMYSLARARMIEIRTGEPFTTFPRVRMRSNRVSALLEFVQDTKDVDWKQRWKLWQGKYPQWSYKSPNSMYAVYYRAVGPKVDAGSTTNEESDYQSETTSRLYYKRKPKGGKRK